MDDPKKSYALERFRAHEQQHDDLRAVCAERARRTAAAMEELAPLQRQLRELEMHPAKTPHRAEHLENLRAAIEEKEREISRLRALEAEAASRSQPLGQLVEACRTYLRARGWLPDPRALRSHTPQEPLEYGPARPGHSPHTTIHAGA